MFAPQFFRSIGVYKLCMCHSKPHSSGQWTLAVRNFELEFRAEIHNIITTHPAPKPANDTGSDCSRTISGNDGEPAERSFEICFTDNCEIGT